MLILQNITYTHPNRDLLFNNLNLIVNRHDKIALTGNNGSGKSTLLKILSGELQPSEGIVKADSKPYYVPQLLGQYNDYTIAQALQIEGKLKALHEILDGHVTEENMSLLNDDWTIEERCQEALALWGLSDFELTEKMANLSGGEKTKVFLAGIAIHKPEVVLLDEPSNHLDISGRTILYNYIETCSETLVVVSHDRTLLNLLNSVCELSRRGITVYGGNYDFYVEQKEIEGNALNQDLKNKEKELRKAKETEKEALERKQKLDARGKKKQEKAGLPRISMKTLKNKAEQSTSHMKDIHSEKVESISKELSQIRKELPAMDKMKMGFDNSSLHRGKRLIEVRELNFTYADKMLWKEPLSFLISSGDRIAIKGLNGSGKTTLIKIILGEVKPQSGAVERADVKAIYVDQDYSLINNQISVYEQAQQFNYNKLQEHEIKIRLNRFLFTKEYWDKPCNVLSGGEKMRLMLCCLTIGNEAIDIIILDEPTNNLDIQNIEILTSAINEYMGTLLVVSHDTYFLNEINIEKSIDLE